MSVALIVPWDETPGRLPAWTWVRRRLHREFQDWCHPTAVDDGRVWSKARVVNAAARATDADVLVVHDADCVVDPRPLRAAVHAVEAGAPWAVPHGLVYRLTYDRTAEVLAGPIGVHPGLVPLQQLQRRPYEGLAGGGIFAVARGAWEAVGGFDERFEGWGSEDASLGYALDTLAGRHARGCAPLWHLYHPMQDRTPQMDRSQALEARYLAAKGAPATMRVLVDEASQGS